MSLRHVQFPGILSLPPELLNETVGYLSAQEIRALRCVNKTLCALLTPAAFREIIVNSTEKNTKGFLDLLVTPDIAKYIKVIRINEHPVSDDAEFEARSEEDEEEGYLSSEEMLMLREERFNRVGNRLRAACLMLHLIPTLESLVFSFFPDEDAWVNPDTYPDDLMSGRCHSHFLQWDVFDGLACNPNPLPALQSLEIDRWFAYYKKLYHAAPFKRIVSSLRDLRFLVQEPHYNGDDDDLPVEDFWKDVIGPCVLQPAVNLTSLAMKCNVEFGSQFRLDLSPINFPCLTSLLLSNLIWDSDDTRVNPHSHVEDFIVRHGKTLKKLELHNCTICVPPHRSTPVRSWAAVWNRFADELTELVGIVVAYYPNRQYFCFLPEYGFESNPASFLGGTEQDTLAREAFGTIVKERKRLTSRDGN